MQWSFPKSLDSAQRLRLRRTLLGFTGYLIFTVPLVYILYFGWSNWDIWGLVVFILASIAVNSVFILLILSGLNQHFADPSMTLAQIATALVSALVVIYLTPEVRGVLLLLFLTSMFFGVFRLRIREFLALVLLTAVGYLIIVFLEFGGQPFDQAYQLEVLRFITLIAVLLWFAVMAGYVASLRSKLRDKNGQLERALEIITATARQDELTQTFNRRHMMLLLGRESERARRYSAQFAVCILDVDHFKQVNDNYGHHAGDTVLRDLVSLVEKAIRGSDLLARGAKAVQTFGRYGGEEFILLMPETGSEGALICVERLRQRIADAQFAVKNTRDPMANKEIMLQVTISAGITEFREGDSVDSLIRRTDEMLYRAKNRGRNCIEAG